MNKKIKLAETEDLIDFLVDKIGEKPVLAFLEGLLMLDFEGDLEKAKTSYLVERGDGVRNWLEKTVISFPCWEDNFCSKKESLYSSLEEIPQGVKDKFLEDSFNLSKRILEESLESGPEDNDDPHYCFELLIPLASILKGKDFWDWYKKL